MFEEEKKREGKNQLLRPDQLSSGKLTGVKSEVNNQVPVHLLHPTGWL